MRAIIAYMGEGQVGIAIILVLQIPNLVQRPYFIKV